MSKYTTTLYDLMEDVNEGKEDLTIDEKITNLASVLFDFTYPYPTPEDKTRIERAIIKHYLMREIAFETVGLFKLKLNDRLNLIMPKYNSAYKNLDDEVSPYINNYIQEKGSNNRNSTSKAQTSGTDTREADTFETTSDTPQGILTELKEGKYSSGARATVSNDSANTSTTSNGSDEEIASSTRELESLQGLTGAEAFRVYFDNLISLDEELVYEFSDLFMCIW